MNDEERGHWYLLTGLVIGIALGLVYAWVVQPVKYVDTPPAALRRDFKDQYRALIAAAYMANHDLVRAKARLELLGDEDMYRAISEQAQRTLAEDGSTHQARALGLLAIALGQEGPGPAIPATAVHSKATDTRASTKQAASSTLPPLPSLTATFTLAATSTPTSTPEWAGETPPPTQPQTTGTTPTPEGEGTPIDTPIPRPTTTPTPTRTTTPTPGGPFVLLSREKICEQKLGQPLIQVEAMNILNQPVPGVLVIVTWESGEERFFTGLKPEKGLGYADFTPAPGIAYTLRLGEGGLPVPDLSAAECQSPSGEDFWGAWVLKFIQP
jgi:hypothetical protein